MAILNNTLETVEQGAIMWRTIYNENFTKLYTKDEIDEKLKGSSTKDYTCKNLGIHGIVSLNGSAVISSGGYLDASTPQGFIKVVVNGEEKRILYYGA